MRGLAEARGTVIGLSGDGPRRISVSVNGRRVEAALPPGGSPRKGERIRFLYDPGDPGREIEIVPDMPERPSAEDAARYLASGRAGFVRDPGRLSGLGEEALADLSDPRASEPALGREDAERLAAFWRARKEADRLYLRLKRACPALSWDGFLRCLKNAGGFGEAGEMLRSDPHAFFRPALGFRDADAAAFAVCPRVSQEKRMDAYVPELFPCSPCVPEAELKARIARDLRVPDDAAEWYVRDRLEDGGLVLDARGAEPLVYTAATYRAEAALAEEIAALAGRKGRRLRGSAPRGPAAGLLRAVLESPLVAVAAGGEGAEAAAALLRDPPALKDGSTFPAPLVVARAHERGMAFFLELFADPGASRIVLIGEGGKPPEGGGAFQEIAASGAFPVLGGPPPERGGRSLLAERIRELL